MQSGKDCLVQISERPRIMIRIVTVAAFLLIATTICIGAGSAKLLSAQLCESVQSVDLRVQIKATTKSRVARTCGRPQTRKL